MSNLESCTKNNEPVDRGECEQVLKRVLKKGKLGVDDGFTTLTAKHGVSQIDPEVHNWSKAKIYSQKQATIVRMETDTFLATDTEVARYNLYFK